MSGCCMRTKGTALLWTAAGLGLVLLVLVTLIAVSMAPTGPTGMVVGPLQGGTVATLGSADAKVTITQWSDFQCPFCGRFHTDAYQQIKTQYIDTGKAKFVYKDFPLSFHPFAQKAAEAGKCLLAQSQERFWAYHDLVYKNQAQLSDENIKAWAVQSGADGAAFTSCLDSGAMAAAVKAEYDEGAAAGIQGTPGFLIDGELVSGALPFSEFQKVIDAKLAG
jgi:protein-disulfide isomerase